MASGSATLSTELLSTLESYSSPAPFSSLFQGKIKPVHVSLPDQPSSECPLDNGYAVGMTNGDVVLFYPPCSKTVSVFPGKEITGLVYMSDYLVAFTGNRYAVIDLQWGEADIGSEGIEGEITTAAKGNADNQVLLGFQDGGIAEYRKDSSGFKIVSSGKYQGPQDKDVIGIRTKNGQGWFVGEYNDENRVTIWRYGQMEPLYRLCRDYDVSIAPQNLPSEGQILSIPMTDYRVFLDSNQISLVDISETTPFTNSFTLSLSKTGQATLTEISLIQYIYRRAKADDKAAFLVTDMVVILNPPNTLQAGNWLYELLKDKETDNVLCVTMESEYTSTGGSETGFYQFFVNSDRVTSLFLGAVETDFTHAHDQTTSQISPNHVFYSYFHQLYDEKGEVVMDLDPGRNYVYNSELTYVYSYDRSKTDWKLKRLEDKFERHQQAEVPITVFSDFDSTLVLIYPTKICLLGLANITLDSFDYTLNLGHLGDSHLFWKPDNWLFAFRPHQIATAVKLAPQSREISLPILKDFECISDIKPTSNDFAVVYKDEMVYYQWNGTNLTEFTRFSGVISDIKPFGNGEYCAITMNRKYQILSLPSLSPMLAFPKDIQLCLHPVNQSIYSYSLNSTSPACLSLTCWDLSLGLPTKTLNFGLASMTSLLEFDCNEKKPMCNQVIERRWRLPEWKIEGNADKGLAFLGAEYVPEYCCAVYRLAQLLGEGNNTELTELTARLVIFPYQVTVLHLLVAQHRPELLSRAMSLGAKVLKSPFGTPLWPCLQNDSVSAHTECLDQLLDGLIALSDSDPVEFLVALYNLEEDFPRLVKSDSEFLVSFLQTVLVPLPKEFVYGPLDRVGDILPLSSISSDLKPHQPSSFKDLFNCFKSTIPVLRICPIPLHMDLQPHCLISVLKDICPSKDVLSQEVITSLAAAKWQEIHLPMILWTSLNWLLLYFLVYRIYDKSPSETYLPIAILTTNSLLLVIEMWQAVTGDWVEYVLDRWNWADWVRFSLTYVWILTEENMILTFFMVVINAFIGLTTFEAFSQTRFLVRMILKVCTHTVYFVLLFVYTNLTFGILCAVTEPEAELSFYDSWTLSFEMSMGNFDNTGVSRLRWLVFFTACIINMVWLLNLIVSLLGTAYEDFTATVQAEDVKAQFERVFQLESMIKCLFSRDKKPYFLHVYKKNPPSENPRQQQVTLHTFREEMRKELKDVKDTLQLLLKTGNKPLET